MEIYIPQIQNYTSITKPIDQKIEFELKKTKKEPDFRLYVFNRQLISSG